MLLMLGTAMTGSLRGILCASADGRARFGALLCARLVPGFTFVGAFCLFGVVDSEDSESELFESSEEEGGGRFSPVPRHSLHFSSASPIVPFPSQWVQLSSKNSGMISSMIFLCENWKSLEAMAQPCAVVISGCL